MLGWTQAAHLQMSISSTTQGIVAHQAKFAGTVKIIDGPIRIVQRCHAATLRRVGLKKSGGVWEKREMWGVGWGRGGWCGGGWDEEEMEKEEEKEGRGWARKERKGAASAKERGLVSYSGCGQLRLACSWSAVLTCTKAA